MAMAPRADRMVARLDLRGCVARLSGGDFNGLEKGTEFIELANWAASKTSRSFFPVVSFLAGKQYWASLSVWDRNGE
jgi:hypothetical protein